MTLAHTFPGPCVFFVHLLFPLPVVVSLGSLVSLPNYFSTFLFTPHSGSDLILATLWYTRGPCHPLAFVLFLCQISSAIFWVATMVKWTRRWKPTWIPYGSSFQRAYAEVGARGPYLRCPNTGMWKSLERPQYFSWRAHELSDNEIFACLTRTDSGDESDSLP